MGIQGLSTWLHENKRSLAKFIEFPPQTEGPSTPIVVDGWGFIYSLYYASSLPWVYGGEYGSFCQLVKTVVLSMIDVRLKLYFVFDGPSPQLKFDTLIDRLVQTRIQPSLLFFRTSSTSRATPRFLRESCSILPTQSYTACVRTLQELAKSTTEVEVHFADEEADPYAVELAGRLGGYVLGHDSDFVVFNTDNYLGYIPIDEMTWNAHDDSHSEHESRDDEDFEVVTSSRQKKTIITNRRTSSRGLVPPDITSGLTLSVECYSPHNMASHLKLPISLLPLMGALLGNDFSKKSIHSDQNLRRRFFERSWTPSQKIQHVTTTLRSILTSSPQQLRQKQVSSVMELIDRTVRALLARSISFISSAEVQGIVDVIVDATLPYTLPKLDQPNSELWPSEVCMLHEPDVCPILPIFSRQIAQLASSIGEENDAVAQRDTIRRLYLAAYRNGQLSHRIVDILNTGSSWPRLFLEHPDTATVSIDFGRPIRQWGYSILEDAVGLPDANTEEGAENVRDANEDEDELIDVVEESDDEDKSASLPDGMNALHVSESVTPGSSGEAPSRSQCSRPPLPKVVTEYVRRGSRVALDKVDVPSLTTLLSTIPGFDLQNAVPLQLRSEEERLRVLLFALNSDTSLVKTLPREQLAVALTLRWVLHCAHSRAQESGGSKDKDRWTKHEARSFLASFSFSESTEDSSEITATVSIEDRNVQLMAQVLVTIESIEHLSQILLLSDRVPAPVPRFSGKLCHAYWTGAYPLDNDGLPSDLWEACTQGLEDGVFFEVKVRNPKKRKAKKESATVLNDASRNHKGGYGLFGLLDHAEA